MSGCNSQGGLALCLVCSSGHPDGWAQTSGRVTPWWQSPQHGDAELRCQFHSSLGGASALFATEYLDPRGGDLPRITRPSRLAGLRLQPPQATFHSPSLLLRRVYSGSTLLPPRASYIP